jgi:hypothetical protein
MATTQMDRGIFSRDIYKYYAVPSLNTKIRHNIDFAVAFGVTRIISNDDVEDSVGSEALLAAHALYSSAACVRHARATCFDERESRSMLVSTTGFTSPVCTTDDTSRCVD